MIVDTKRFWAIRLRMKFVDYVRSQAMEPRTYASRKRLRAGALLEHRLAACATNSWQCQTLHLQQTLADCPHGGLSSVRDADLSQDMLHVFLDRFVTDVERVGDLFVRQSVCQLP